MQAIFLRKKKKKGSVLLGTKRKEKKSKKNSRDEGTFHPTPAEMEMVVRLGGSLGGRKGGGGAVMWVR